MEDFRPIHRTIRARAAESPDAPAITDPHATLTYRHLIARSDELAATLVRGGVRPGDAVAVHMRRGCALLVALLAVSRAGAGSLMLDIDGPERWLARFVELARPTAWITHDDQDGQAAHPHASARAPAPADSYAPRPQRPQRMYRLDTEGRAPGAHGVGAAPRRPQALTDGDFPEVGPEDLACLVQTSGSTGEPKLVLVPHRTWSYAAATQQRLHALTPRERGGWLFPAHTNVAVSVVVWPFLAAGARLCVPDPRLMGSPEELAAWIRDQGLTQFFAVAPLAEALAKLDWPASPLRLMLTGSDRVREWGRPELPFEIGNWYGANEVNIVTSSIVPWHARITSATVDPRQRSGPPPIGRVWPGVSFRVTDPEGRPVPVGEIGELHVSGRQLAIGYHSARATAEKFLPDEDGTGPGARIYRTGDLVRVRADGVFEYCGRVDEQAKINGMRVEMAEVERALLACAGVEEAAAAAVETPSGRAHLVGYIVAPDDRVTDASLRGELAAALPAHMVPVAFVRMDRLPRNRGDKIDRRALPHPGASAAGGADALIERITEVLGKVTRHRPYGPGENFFLVGGDSLLAARAARELSRRLERTVLAKDVLLHPTAQELAAALREN